MTPETLCPVCGQDNDPSGPGCDCYGIPEPLPPYYPPTAVLAAFRAAIHAPASLDTLHPPATLPCRWDAASRYTDPIGRPVSGAWADERTAGIGYRLYRSPMPLGADLAATGEANARREASALRSRAFDRGTDCHPELIGIIGAWTRERTEGCPDRFGPMLAAVPWRTGKAPLPPR